MMMLIPRRGPASIHGAKQRAFYEYHAALMEPWDGPAIAFTDEADRGDAGPQQPAPGAVHHHRPGPRHPRLGGQRARGSRGGTIGKTWPAARQDAADRHGWAGSSRTRNSRRPSRTPLRRSGWLQAQFKLEGLEVPPPWEAARANGQPTCSIASEPSNTQEDIAFFLEPMGELADDPVGSMGTEHPWRCSRPARACSTTISSRTSPRSATRRSTRSARSWS